MDAIGYLLKPLVELYHLVSVSHNTFTLEVVPAVAEELGGRDVECDHDVVAGLNAPAASIASMITAMASSFDFKFGAKPPSRPQPCSVLAGENLLQAVEDLRAPILRGIGKRRLRRAGTMNS